MEFEDFVFCLEQEIFHAVKFKLDGVERGFAGWWIAWDETERTYLTKNEMISAELPRIQENFERITDIDFTME